MDVRPDGADAANTAAASRRRGLMDLDLQSALRALRLSGAADHRRRADPDGGAAQEDRRRHRQAGRAQRIRGGLGRAPEGRRRRGRQTARALVEARHEKLHISGLWAGLYNVAKAVREMGYSAKDFNPENSIYVGGGLKRAEAARRLPRVRLRDVQHPARAQLPELLDAGAALGHAALPEGRPLSPAAVAGAAGPRQGRATSCCRSQDGEYEGRAAFFDLSLDGRWGGVISGDKISIDFEPCACGAGARRSATTSRATPTSKATTRSAAPEPSMLTCEVWHEHLIDRPDSAEAAEAVVSAPFFIPRQAGRGRRRDPPLARPRRHLRHAEARPRRGRSTRAPRCRRCSTCRSARSSTSWSRPASGSRDPKNPIIAGLHRAHVRRRTSCRASVDRQIRATARRYLDKQRADGRGRAELPRSAGARRMGAQAGLHRPQELRPRLRAAADPRAARQFAGRRGQVDRPGRAGQGGQPVQDGLAAIRSPRSRSCGRWPRSIPSIRSCSRCRRSTGAAATTRSSACSIARSTSTRSSPGAAATRSTTSIKYLGPGFQLVSFDPEDLDLDGRRARRSSPRRRWSRSPISLGRRHDAQPGGLRRQPLPVRRGRPRSRSTASARSCTARIARARRRLGRRAAARHGAQASRSRR